MKWSEIQIDETHGATAAMTRSRSGTIVAGVTLPISRSPGGGE